MLPDPLHPAVVHLPVALAMLIPLLGLLAAFVIRQGWLPVRSWLAILLLQVVMIGSGVLAHETGEHEEERVEKVVAERLIEAHEEAAGRFMWVAGAALLVSLVGLMQDRRGEIARFASVAVSLAALAAIGSAGHLGGELVYKHGAASAYAEAPSGLGGGTDAGAPAPIEEHD